MRSMSSVVILVAVCAAAHAGKAPSAEKTLSDAELYVKVKTAEIRKQAAADLVKARADAEREIALRYQAKLAELKRQLVVERARSAEFRQKLDDAMEIIKGGTAAAEVKPTPGRWGSPVFTDGFGGREIGSGWDKAGLAKGGHRFRIADGMLTGKETIRMARRFTARAVRVEYDAWTLSQTPCDASIVIEVPEKSYRVFAGIGGELNRVSRITIGGKTVVAKQGKALVRGRRQHMVVEVGQGVVRTEVDGKTLNEYRGAQAPKALKDVAISLYTWTPGMHFDNVRVYVIP